MNLIGWREIRIIWNMLLSNEKIDGMRCMWLLNELKSKI